MDGCNAPGFRPDIDRLRGLAIVLVVLSHATWLSRETPVGEALYTSLRGATWIFVFIAGYLFAHLADRHSYASYLGRKVQTVLAPYLVVTSLIAVLGLATLQPATPLELLLYYAGGFQATASLWFVPMIVLFYLAFPAYRALLREPGLLLVLAGVSVIASMVMGRPPHFDGAPANFAYFQSAYLVGMAWRVHQDRFDDAVARFLPILILLFLIGVNLGTGSSAPMVGGQIYAMMPLALLLLPAMRAKSPLNPLWSWLADRSFGIFFLHGVFIDLVATQVGSKAPPLLAIALGIVLTIGCGLFVSLLRGLVGETRSRVLVGA